MRKQQGWRRGVLAAMAVLTLVVSWRCDRAAEPRAPAVQTVDPARILRQMSDTLAHARQLTFKATRQLDAALVEGGVVGESAEIEVSISRPQMVRARMVSGASVRRFYADGERVSLLDEGMNLYATVSLAGTIDDMVNALDERYGFTPPLADFVVNDPYQKFSTQIQSSLYKGKEAVIGVECDHLTLTGEIADADVWISIADHLPRRFVATFKDREGTPRLKVDFSEWTLAAKLDESTFVFNPPRGAEKIVMAAVEDVKASEVKDGKR
jgi:hypothetical protein